MVATTTFDLSGRTALITGATRGIGAAIAQCFAKHGANVMLANRSLAKSGRVVDAIRAMGGNAEAVEYDATAASSNEAVVDSAIRCFGGLDIVVHNAASITSRPIETMSDELLDLALDVNLKPCFWLARAAVPAMRARGGGRILITSSVTGPRVASSGLGHYGASKAAVNGFIRSAAMELASYGITVNGVEPGFIAQPELGRTGDDEFSKSVDRFIPLGRIGRPEDIAHAMLFLASDEAGYVTGQTIIVDGGATLPESPVAMNKPLKD